MHQEHHIPWNLLAKNVQFAHDNSAHTPRHTGFFAKSPNAGELNHFVRTLSTTIRTFSRTERAKYPSPWPHAFPSSGPIIYSDAVKVKHHEFLDDERQKIETWIQRVHRGSALRPNEPRYSTSHGDLSDVVKILFVEAVEGEDGECGRKCMETLLMLANHPDVPLGTLVSLSWGHHFGWSRVMESALRTYVLLNLILAVGTRSNGGAGMGGKGDVSLAGKGDYMTMPFYEFTYQTETSSMDYSAQQVPHRKFWNMAREAERMVVDEGAARRREELKRPPPMHLNVAKLKEYLKVNFALLYTYDMVIRECGMAAGWEGEITLLLNCMVKGFKVDSGSWLDAEGRWSTPAFI